MIPSRMTLTQRTIGIDLRSHGCSGDCEADFLSLHLPLTAETRGMVNDAFLAKMKKGSYLINTSRGEVVDEAALLRALESGHLRGAGLDAFAVEPPDPANPLLAPAAGDRHPASGRANRWRHQQHGLVRHAGLPGCLER